jgi:hypothetical protein
MNHNRFAVLSDELVEKKKKPKKQAVSGSSSHQLSAPSEGSNNESGISPILGTVVCEDLASAQEPAPPLLFSAMSRPPLKLVQRERPVIADLSNPDDLGSQRTNKRVELLNKKLTQLREFMASDPEPSLISLMILERHLIGITEVLIRLRENFKARHYDKLVQEYEINGVNIRWPKIIRNKIVHEYVMKDWNECYDHYVQLARAVMRLGDNQAINLKSFIVTEKDYAPKETHKLEYNEDIELKLNKLFNDIVEYKDKSNVTQLMSMTRAAEIISQLLAQDQEILNSGKIKIMGQTLDPEIVPYMMVIRKVIYHNISDFPDDHADAVLAYAKSLSEHKKSNKNKI